VENEPHDRRPSSSLFGSGYAANHMPFLKRAWDASRTLEKKCVDSGGEYVED
jgi:hypothetical protein